MPSNATLRHLLKNGFSFLIQLEMQPNATVIGKILYLQKVGVTNLPPLKKSRP
jgi:hypothetical protein